MGHLIVKFLLIALLFFTNTCFALNGVNVGEGSFGKTHGRMFFDYKYASNDDILGAKTQGFSLIRVPILWERFQPTLNKPLNEVDAKELDRIVEYATSLKMTVEIDLHNYGGYSFLQPNGTTKNFKVGTNEVPVSALSNFWLLMNNRYWKYNNVWYGLMNEPVGVNVAQWAQAQQTVVNSLRLAGSKNMIVLSGNNWTGAHSFLSLQVANDVNSSNAYHIGRITDPLNMTLIDVHQYFNHDSSGTTNACVSETVGVERIAGVTEWARRNGKKLFLGEFASGRNDVCQWALKNVIDYMALNKDVWHSWTYWASAEWFGTAYEFNIHHKTIKNPMQLLILKSN